MATDDVNIYDYATKCAACAIVLHPSSNNELRTILQCLSCESKVCLNCMNKSDRVKVQAIASTQNTTIAHNNNSINSIYDFDHENREQKLSVSSYLGDGSSCNVQEKGDIIEDVEPVLKLTTGNHDLYLYCPACSISSTFIMYNLYKSCLRCNSNYFDCGDTTYSNDNTKSMSTCIRHSGKHELPVDKRGNITYNFRLQPSDCPTASSLYYYQIAPAYFPARWSCCGELCMHNTVHCPLEIANTTDPLPITYNLQSLGCKYIPHTSDKQEVTTEIENAIEQQKITKTELPGLESIYDFFDFKEFYLEKCGFNTNDPVCYATAPDLSLSQLWDEIKFDIKAQQNLK